MFKPRIIRIPDFNTPSGLFPEQYFFIPEINNFLIEINDSSKDSTYPLAHCFVALWMCGWGAGAAGGGGG
eukprot:4731455-Pyramimonas_sp.AAC.1